MNRSENENLEFRVTRRRALAESRHALVSMICTLCIDCIDLVREGFREEKLTSCRPARIFAMVDAQPLETLSVFSVILVQSLNL